MPCVHNVETFPRGPQSVVPFRHILLLLFAIIRSVLKSFKVPDVEVVAARMSNESELTCMTDSIPKNFGYT